MPSNSFRNKSGQYTPGGNLTLNDLRSWIWRTPGDHWLPPPTLPIGGGKPWRIPRNRFPELVGIFPPDSRPSVRKVFWTTKHNHIPERLRTTCTCKGCLNPDHQEEIYMTPEEVYFTYFIKAFEFAEKGEVLSLNFANEGEAVTYRQRLNAFRHRGLSEHRLPESWKDLSLRIRKDGEQFILFADLPSSSLETALAAALGVESLEENSQPSALDLLNELE